MPMKNDAKTEAEKKTLDSYIGKNVRLKGVLHFKGSLMVDGEIEGEVITHDTLIVGKNGNVNADIRGGLIINRGKINGNVTAEKVMAFHANSILSGNITAPSVFIEEGAVFQGSCQMPRVESAERSETASFMAQQIFPVKKAAYAIAALLIIGLLSFYLFSPSRETSSVETTATVEKAEKTEKKEKRGDVETAYKLKSENRLKEAELEFNKVLKNSPQDLNAMLGLAEIYFQTEREPEGEALCQKVLTLNTNNLRAHEGLAAFYQKKGLTDKSLFHFQKITEIDPNRFDAFYSVGENLGNKGMIDSSIAAFEKVVQLKPDHAKALTALSELYLKKEMPSKAISVLEKLIKIEPDVSKNYINLGELYIRNERKEEGITLIQKVLEKEPQNTTALYYLASYYYENGNNDKATELLKRLLDIEPNYVPALNRLAWIYALQGINLNAALEMSQKAVELQPGVAGYLDTLAELYYRKREYIKAIETINQAIQLEPERPYFQRQLSKFQNALNQGRY
jgi:tetratricopeptide (TPR) repeat protein